MRAFAVLLVLSFLAVGLVPLAAADDDSLKVVVVVEDKNYSVGTTGKVTVHVFDKGVHVDADAAPMVSLGVYPSRAINVTKKSVGVYEGSFTLQPGDVSGGVAMISGAATLGKANQSDTSYNEDSDTATLFLPGAAASTGLSVSCYPRSVSGGALKPGATVTIEAWVTYNGTPLTPSHFTLTVTYYDRDHNDVVETLNTTSSTTGLYQAVYNLPDLPYDADLTFEAFAVHESDSDSDTTTLSLDFFNIVYHRISRTSTSTTFDLYITDIDGKVVSGAVISLSYPPDNNGSEDKTVEAAPTDAGGKTRATLTFSEGLKALSIQGTINASGKSQEFYGGVRLPTEAATPPTPSGDEFEILYPGTEEAYKPGSTVNRDYYVFNDSKAWAGKPVYCYCVFSTYSLTTLDFVPISVEAKNITTDSSGKLRLSVRTPADKDTIAEVYFESATGTHAKPGDYPHHDSNDGQYYSEDTDIFVATKGTSIGTFKVTIKELKLGAPTQVEASAGSGDRPLAFAAWGPGGERDLFVQTSPDMEWIIWNQLPSLMVRDGSKYTGTVNIPAFMPHDSKYTVMVMLESDDSMPAYGMATLRPGEGTDGGGIPWMWIYIIIAIVVVVIVVAVVVAWARRRPAYVAQTDVINFAGKPDVTQLPPVPPGGSVAPGETAGPAGPGAPPMPPPPPPMGGAPPAQYPQPAPQQYPPQPQQYPQPAPQQYPPQPAYVAAPPPVGQLPPPSKQGRVTMPNNAMCAFCNQWLLQGSTGIMCQCGKYYHEHCAKIQEQCLHCGTKLAL